LRFLDAPVSSPTRLKLACFGSAGTPVSTGASTPGVGGTGMISSVSTCRAKKRVASSSPSASVASSGLFPNIASQPLSVCGRSSGFTTIAASIAARNFLL